DLEAAVEELEGGGGRGGEQNGGQRGGAGEPCACTEHRHEVPPDGRRGRVAMIRLAEGAAAVRYPTHRRARPDSTPIRRRDSISDGAVRRFRSRSAPRRSPPRSAPLRP